MASHPSFSTDLLSTADPQGSPFLVDQPTRPKTFAVPPSGLFSQVRGFLPVIRGANEQLASQPNISAEPEFSFRGQSSDDSSSRFVHSLLIFFFSLIEFSSLFISFFHFFFVISGNSHDLNDDSDDDDDDDDQPNENENDGVAWDLRALEDDGGTHPPCDVAMDIVSLGLLSQDLDLSDNPMLRELLTDPPGEVSFTPEAGSLRDALTANSNSSFFDLQTPVVRIPLLMSKELLEFSTQKDDDDT
ncbi:MAG: hypothetical protein Q8P67_15455 [archaeon]|nr:hypothetical protein [archaeon]